MSELKKMQDHIRYMMTNFEKETHSLEVWIKENINDERKVFLSPFTSSRIDMIESVFYNVANISQLSYFEDTGGNTPITQVLLDKDDKVIEIISKTIKYRDGNIYYLPYLDFTGDSDYIYEYFKLISGFYISTIYKDFTFDIRKLSTRNEHRNEAEEQLKELLESLNIPKNFMKWTDDHLVMLRLAYQ